MIALHSEVMENWTRIHERDCSIVVEERHMPLSEDDIALLLAKAPFALRVEGELDELAEQLAELPDTLVADILALAKRFAELTGQLTGNSSLRVRLEGVTTNACKKVHADYTDIRLITTYAGPGTDYTPHGDPGCCLVRVPTGAVALFKGRLFGALISEEGHEPCFHRSPPIESSGEARLVLVIDTPARATE